MGKLKLLTCEIVEVSSIGYFSLGEFVSIMVLFYTCAKGALSGSVKKNNNKKIKNNNKACFVYVPRF